MTQLLEVGRITKPHGLQGDVLVKYVTDMIQERTAIGAAFTLSNDREVVIERASLHNDRWIVHFEGVDSRDAAQALQSQILFAEPLEDPGTIFIHEIIGKRLRTEDGTDHGEIVTVLDNPASDLMELESGRLVPMAFYLDHDDEFVTVDVPAGLLEDLDE
ncbi:MAG: 16S rRNA processing protein RimM [Acidimicrobiales bacterium]|nr:16S rRNA processing protein RimM [Acidimicrobiales bacterium]